MTRLWPALLLLATACSSPSTDAYGVRLGFSANDVRSRFAPPVAGSWTSAMEPEPVLRWKASAPSSLDEATFEIHSGMLVAETFVVAPDAAVAKGPPLETTTASLTARAPEGNRVRVRVLSRDCPTHRAEVAALLGGAPPPSSAR